MRSVSDAFSSLNDGLDLSNFRASLNAKMWVCKSKNVHNLKLSVGSELEEERMRILVDEM